MPDQSATSPGKPWYTKWWVWLIAGVLVVGGISALVNPSGEQPTTAVEPTQTAPAEPAPSSTAAEPAPLDLEAFLTDSGVDFESARLSARKVVIYVPTATTNEQAQQIAADTMRYVCEHAEQAGDKHPAANRVEVSDSVSRNTAGYNAADHPSGFATDDVCEG